jgi:protein-S-isoprenylcysteine O-methyltransferase Ste14
MAVLVVMTANYWIKAKREDRLLSAKFGDSFADYKRRAGFLVPKR